MFIPDKPIDKEKDDFLGRVEFSQKLGKSLLNWNENESLVVAIYGKWGSGKSSVINMALECIRNSTHENKPTIIEFNPWLFAEQDKLRTHFFNEISKELKIKNDTRKDVQIANELKRYVSILNLVPHENVVKNIISKPLLLVAISSLSGSKIFEWLNLSVDWINNTLMIIGILLLIVEFFKDTVLKFAKYFEERSRYYSQTVSELKQNIKRLLLERKKKLIVVIDDIDRLNQSEIRQIFKLIRVNADFPNTIYLIAFDREIIEKNLEEQIGVSGKEYLNKIIQVNFDIPLVNPSKIHKYLFEELDRILNTLPKSAQQYFDQNDSYWANIFHSGLKNLFKNIRDVKRFASSLEFNISQMYKGNVMEVNPVDFIAVESIRIFAPNFYLFMRNKKVLFTSTNEREFNQRENNPRKLEIEKECEKLPYDVKEHVIELLKRLFPQVDDLFLRGCVSHSNDFQTSWSNKLRVCASKNYDSYFTLIPGGDEQEISQYEIEDILNKTNSRSEFEQVLRENIENKRIRKVLERLENFTEDKIKIKNEHIKNIVLALFNIADDLPDDKTGIWDFGVDIEIMRIIRQLLKRTGDRKFNYEILKDTIPLSKSIFAPIQKISLETSRKEGENNYESVVPEEKIIKLQQLCLSKLYKSGITAILTQKNLPYILYRCREWDEENRWESIINEVNENDELLLLFITKFIMESMSQSVGDYGIRIKKNYNFKNINDFIDVVQVKMRLEKMKSHNDELYRNNKNDIETFLEFYGKYEDDNYE